jgi:hypothetical protein
MRIKCGESRNKVSVTVNPDIWQQKKRIFLRLVFVSMQAFLACQDGFVLSHSHISRKGGEEEKNILGICKCGSYRGGRKAAARIVRTRVTASCFLDGR